MARSLALFDFDGTLTTCDSLADFIIYAVGIPKVLLGTTRLAPLMLLYKMGIMDNGRAKERVISYFFKEWDAEIFSQTGREYAQQQLPHILRPEAVKRLQWHLEQNHEIAIVTASIEDWIITWTNNINVELIGTRIEKKDGILSGRFATKNCYGKEKVRRINEKYQLSRFKTIYAYGDSSGDKPMLQLADKAFYKSF